MQTECSVLGYKVDLYFDDYNLLREVDEFGHSDINIGYEIERSKAMEKNLAINLLELILMKRIKIFLKL